MPDDGPVSTRRTRPLKVLWLCSRLEFPARAGGSAYSVGLAQALAATGSEVAVFGIGTISGADQGLLKWHLDPRSAARHPLRALMSVQPVMTARMDVRSMRRRLAELLEEDWDLVGVNHLMSVWAVPQLEEARKSGRVARWWYVSQNDEVQIWRQAVRLRSSSVRARFGRLADLPKIWWAQRRLLRSADAVTAITLRDLASLARRASGPVLYAPPGPSADAQMWMPDLGAQPRAVVIAGSLTWALKLENLRELLAAAVPSWNARDIPIIVAGRIAEADRQELLAAYPTVRVLGEIDDLKTAYRMGRLAVIHEPRGGGFKMKALDLIVAGMPIAATRGSLAGLEGGSAIEFEDLSSLVEGVPQLLADDAALEEHRTRARQEAYKTFSWNATAERLRGALEGSSPITGTPNSRPATACYE